MNIISREEARALGLKQFFTNEPCKHGHVDARLVSNGGCMACARIRINKKNAENREINHLLEEPRKALHIKWLEKNPDYNPNINIITREEALELGLTRFFTGEPCKYGHIDTRQVSSGRCRSCYNMWQNERNANNRESKRIQDKKFYAENTEARKASHLKWREKNPGYFKEYGEKNKEKLLEKGRKLYYATIEYQKERSKRYRMDHLEERREKSREYIAKDRERHNARGRLWAKNNPEQHRTIGRNRRARIRDSIGTHTIDEILDLFVRQSMRCANCKKKLAIRKYEVDHIVPISKEGRNDIKNLQILCMKCNRRKGHSDPIVFAQRNGRLL